MSPSLFWLSDEALGGDRAASAAEPAWRAADGRPTGDLHVLTSGCRWSDVPAAYGPPTTIYNRWNRWSRRGIWTRILAALTEEGWIAETAQIDSSFIKVHRCAHGAKGRRKSAIGISRGGRTTKIPALVDVIGRPLRLVLTPGNTSDIRGADLLIADAGRMKRMIADRGYDANKLRATLRAQETIPSSPVAETASGRSNMTSAATRTAGASKQCSAASMTSAASPPDTTRSPETISQPSTSRPPSPLALNESEP